ncbi:hypothetical protein Lal_00030067 [Lupinus albus]|nr:hypothetical protein Lal_00030067 [Lupinus albus]
MIALIEAVAIGRTFEYMKDYQLDENKELVALGAMNVVGSMTSCYVAEPISFVEVYGVAEPISFVEVYGVAPGIIGDVEWQSSSSQLDLYPFLIFQSFSFSIALFIIFLGFIFQSYIIKMKGQQTH